AAAELVSLLTVDLVADAVGKVPTPWLAGDNPGLLKTAYVAFLMARIEALPALALEANNARAAVDYAVVRWVPSVDRGEYLNVGVLIYCAVADHIACRVELDARRAAALWPTADLSVPSRHLSALASVCRGDSAAGPVAEFPTGERFHWLVHPRSAALQVSAVHAGLSEDLDATLEQLFVRLVQVRRDA
ncbi:MAG: DUF3037 domain-containing protein, partial [Nannocystaceae bacterium]|nr:DUF3037 domain-containing protein [Nannocystaceae bacterium]